MQKGIKGATFRAFPHLLGSMESVASEDQELVYLLGQSLVGVERLNKFVLRNAPANGAIVCRRLLFLTHRRSVVKHET